MNWKERVVESLLEGHLKAQRKEQTKHGARPMTLRYKRGGKMKGKTTIVGKGFVRSKKGKGGTYTGKPTRRVTTSPTPGWATQSDEPTVPPMGKPGSDARRRYDQYKRDVGVR